MIDRRRVDEANWRLNHKPALTEEAEKAEKAEKAENTVMQLALDAPAPLGV